MNKETSKEGDLSDLSDLSDLLDSQSKNDLNVSTQESTIITEEDPNGYVSNALTQNSNSILNNIKLTISLENLPPKELVTARVSREQSPPRDGNDNQISSIKSIELEYSEQETRSGWALLYARLNDTSAEVIASCSAARLPENSDLNRYTNILANDSTRVKLTGLSTDYINANFVAVERAGTNYIMTQGPLPETCVHFWHMVWQLECPGVVMLNRLVERGMKKCHSYFPTSLRSCLQFGAITVICERREEKKNYFQTKLRLENESDSNPRFLTHFQYTSWPDFGAPVSPHSFLKFLCAVRATGILHDPHKPSVIHCSAGVGRSGTFILIDSCLLIAERDESCNDVSILDTVLEMRRQRSGCIQSKEQLRFSYACVIHGMKSRNGNNVICPEKSSKRSRVGSLGDCKEGNTTKKKKC